MPKLRKPAAAAAAPELKKIALAARIGDAREVLLAGDFNGWSGRPVPLKKAADGTWSATLSLAPGEYQYRLLVDGQWRDHPEAVKRVPNPYGGENCVLTVA